MYVFGSLASLVWRFRKLAAITLIVTLFVTITVLAQQISEARKKGDSEREKGIVARLENDWLNALNTADVNEIDRVLADDFIRPAPDSGHFITKAELLSYYRSHLSSRLANERRFEDLTMILYESTAIARGTLISVTSEDHVVAKLLFTDVFVRRNGNWLAVSAQENTITESPVRT